MILDPSINLSVVVVSATSRGVGFYAEAPGATCSDSGDAGIQVDIHDANGTLVDAGFFITMVQ